MLLNGIIPAGCGEILDAESARPYRGGLAGSGLALGWDWLTAVGVAPLIVSAAPCLLMCALGLCMMRRGYVSAHPESNGNYLVDHSSFFYLINPEGRFVRVIAGDVSGEELAERLRHWMNKSV